MTSYCFHCDDTGNRAVSGEWRQCSCTDGISRFDWCKRVVNHRKRQGKAMTQWVIDEWLNGRLASCYITPQEYAAIVAGDAPMVQLRLL